MAMHKKILAAVGLILVFSAVQTEAFGPFDNYIYIYKNKKFSPHQCLTCARKDFLATVGVVGLVAGSIYAIKACYDYFHWTDWRIERWARTTMAEIHERYLFIDNLKTDLQPHNAIFIERLTDFGLNTKNSSLDHILRAAAPLHAAVDSMSTDFASLCTIIKECGKRHFISSRLVDDSLAQARLLQNIIAIVCQTKEYKKEAVEIEKITNGRLSVQLQQQALMQSMHQHNVVVVIEED